MPGRIKRVIYLFGFLFVILPISNGLGAATLTQISAGLSAGVGTELDEVNNHLYFVQYNAPELKRIILTPVCENDPATACVEEVIATGFSHAEDVVLDIEQGVAYVTTRDNPGTGGLWKVDIATGSKTLVTFNLGAPQQLVLDLAINQGYVVGYNDGRLRRVDLNTGAKTPIITTLDNPVGLAISSDLAFAYVTEQGAPARISKIDLTLGAKVEDVVTHGIGGVSLIAPFFLDWSDSSQNSLYITEREPANRVSRLDLGTAELYSITTGLAMPWRPTGLAAKGVGTPLFVTTENEIIKLDFIELSGPIFMAVGHVPSSSISAVGYADTVSTLPGYFYKVRHSPFGGTMNIFGNFTTFLEQAATYYAVKMSKDGVDSYLTHTWRVSRWDVTEFKYKAVTITPELDGFKYRIPVEDSDGLYHPELWWYPYWMMRWPSNENGEVTFSIELFSADGSLISNALDALSAPNSLTLYIDNSPPTLKINKIMQTALPVDHEVLPCEIIDSGNNELYFEITAYDANQHLRNYWLEVLWGDNKHETIVGYSDNYENHIDLIPPHAWSGVINFIPKDSLGDKITWQAKCNCAHTFYLRAKKRTINGYNYVLRRRYHKSVTINRAPDSCGITPCGFPCP